MPLPSQPGTGTGRHHDGDDRFGDGVCAHHRLFI